jgi:hypothetical protein
LSAVQVTITSKAVGKALTFPYQRHMLDAGETPIYEVPTYEVQVGGSGGLFRAVRFGLTPVPPPWPKVRHCNTGLTAHHKVFPTWIHYDTHSFGAQGIRGAWRIMEGHQFLLHEGATPPGAGASLGCVEIVDFHSWNRFIHTVERIAGCNCHQITARGLLELTIEHAHFPLANLKEIRKS